MDVDISVIVPVYKTDFSLLCRCIDSILNQNFAGTLELILSFDGPDIFLENCCRERYALAKAIRYCINEHQGVSATRNRALSAANGKYLMFCDSDDRFAKDICQNAFDAAESGHADMVIWNYVCVYGNKEIVSRLYASEWEREIPEIYLLFYSNICKAFDKELLPNVSFGIGGIWNRLYRTQLIKQEHIKFNETLKLSEDILFNIEMAAVSKKVKYIDKNGYYYYQIISSSSNKYDSNEVKKNTDFLQALEAFRIKSSVLQGEEGKRFRRAQNVLAVNSLMRIFGNGFFSKITGQSFVERIKYFLRTLDSEPYYTAIRNGCIKDFAGKQKASFIALRFKLWPMVILLTWGVKKVKLWKKQIQIK